MQSKDISGSQISNRKKLGDLNASQTSEIANNLCGLRGSEISNLKNSHLHLTMTLALIKFERLLNKTAFLLQLPIFQNRLKNRNFKPGAIAL